MMVKFEFKDKYDTTSFENNLELEMSDDKVNALFKSDQIDYPIKRGNSTGFKSAVIEKTVFNMYRPEEICLKVFLKEE